jgi:uncharacterized membrane protein YraQ (UPF0718 family)
VYNYAKSAIGVVMDVLLYSIAGILLVVSAVKDRKKTLAALKRSWKAFMNLLPALLGVMGVVGIMLALLEPEKISSLIGDQSGWMGTVLAAVVGSITLIPGFIAFPTAELLLERGAGYLQIAMFVSTLMSVGIITLPVEITYFGKRSAYMRNTLSLLLSVIVAYTVSIMVVLL